MTIKEFYNKFKIFEENRLLGLKDIKTDNVIIPAICQAILPIFPYHYGGKLYLKVKKNKKYLLYDLSGNIVLKEHDYIGEYSNGIMPVKIKDSWGFVNSEAKLFVYPHYSRVEELLHGMFKVKINGKWGIVAEQGEVVDPIYTDIIIGYGKLQGKINGKFEEIKF